MNAWDLGVAVAAAAVSDPERAEPSPEAAGGERRAVVGAERELARLDPVRADGLLDHGDRFVGAAAQAELPADDLAGAAVDDRVQVAPAVLGDPDEVMSSCQSCPGRSTWKKPGRRRRRERAAALDQPPLPHHPQHPLAVDRAARACAARTRSTIR